MHLPNPSDDPRGYDEDGVLLPTEEQVKHIIEAISPERYKIKKTEADTCAICIEELKIYQSVKELPCNHFFHSKCINEWFMVKLKCPLCKNYVFEYDEDE